MLKILITPSPEKCACFWCENKKKLTVITEFNNGFLRGKPLCFDCLERAVRVQSSSEAIRAEQANPSAASATSQAASTAATPSVPEGKSRKDSAE